jgi:putative transposase
VSHDIRDEVIDYVRYWSQRTGIPTGRMICWIGIGRSKYYAWRERYGKVNEHNAWIPRDFWLEKWEEEAIVSFYRDHPREGYRRLTYMMLDADIVAVSPSSVYRVLKRRDLLGRWNRKVSKKGRGFEQPLQPHEHWHTDISYINICGTFYYLCAVLDGYSRYIVHWEIRESMTERDVETILQRAKEKFPEERSRIITDNGPQFLAKDFREFIRLCGMTHVKTSPYYPQSNGKIERWNQSLKRECIRPKTPLSLEEARRVVTRYVEEYNTIRLHSAIGYISPKDKLEGRAESIFAERDAKLAVARQKRAARRKQQHTEQRDPLKPWLTTRKEMAIFSLAGETDAGSAGGQPARDSRLGGDGYPSGGVPELPHPSSTGYPEPSSCLRKLKAPAAAGVA